MYFLADFSFIPLTYKKKRFLLSKYTQKAKKNMTGILREEMTWDFPSNKKKEAQYLMLDEMSNNSDKDNVQLLTKKYRDKATGKLRKVFTGIAEIDETNDRLKVPYLVGNPKAFNDPKFKGATNSLKQISNKKKKPIQIGGINSKVEQLYTSKLNRNLPDDD